MVSLTIRETLFGWDVVMTDGGSTYPTTSYTNPDAAAARVLQLLGIDHCVEPQNTPEDIEIG